MVKIFLISILCCFSLTSCDWGTHVVNKISGHEENCCDDEAGAGVAYHEERHEPKSSN